MQYGLQHNQNLSENVEFSGDSSTLLRRFFEEFLDNNQFEDFRYIENLLTSLREAGKTQAGHPLLRPRDCSLVTQALSQIFEVAQPRFRIGDPRVVLRFERIISEFTTHCASLYPSEASAALALHGRVLLFLGQHQRVLDVVGEWVARPYALEGTDHILSLAELYGQAHLRLGTLSESGISFVALGLWLAANSGSHITMQLGPKLAPYVSLDARAEVAGSVRAGLIRFASRRLLMNARIQGRAGRMVASFLMWHVWRVILAFCYSTAMFWRAPVSPYALRANRLGTTLVTRAMGGIGDLLMMTPGLEALAAKQKQPVDFAIPRKYFAIFKGNVHIRPIDIHGPPLDIASYRRFVNLSNCPASHYESGVRPAIRKDRVEVFAIAMGIHRGALDRQGWRINRVEEADDAAFCERFLAEKGFGQRRLVGVAPFSRDSYKDYPAVAKVIADLVRDYDVLIFHHIEAGVPVGPGIATTAGLSLEKSLALVAHLDAMVAVDSAFLHAAAAYDYPVIALFGPTDGRPLTRHHRQAKVLSRPEAFACVPCWRNEDSPCALTELRVGNPRANGTFFHRQNTSGLVAAYSVSPCMVAIPPAEIVAAVASAMAGRAS